MNSRIPANTMYFYFVSAHLKLVSDRLWFSSPSFPTPLFPNNPILLPLFPPLLHPPALKDDRFQMVLFSPRLVRITLTNVSVWDEGGYFCQLYTDATHHQVATLSVLVPPETPTVEVKQEAVEGGEVELTCVSQRSKPAATLRWVRNGREIPGTPSGWRWMEGTGCFDETNEEANEGI